MDYIQHNFVKIGGLNLHVAELGPSCDAADLLCAAATATVIVFLHGFPEIWYSWRHQMLGVSNAGYRALAPDFRGYGLSEIPSGKTNFIELVDDLLGVLDQYKIQKAFLVGKDFGAQVAYSFELLHSNRVQGIVTLGVPFVPSYLDVQIFKKLPEEFYVKRWMKPGRAEADFGRFTVEVVVRRIYILFARDEIPIAKRDNQEILDLVNKTTPLPPWFTKKDLKVYGKLFKKSGFSTPLQMPYRAMPVDFGKTVLRVSAPALLILGRKDYFYAFPGIKQYIDTGVKKYVPNMNITFMSQGTHFIQEQYPKKVVDVRNLLDDFLIYGIEKWIWIS